MKIHVASPAGIVLLASMVLIPGISPLDASAQAQSSIRMPENLPPPVGDEMRVEAPDLDAVLADQNVVLLDVREPWELEKFGTRKGYINIPLGELEDRLDELPTDKTILNRLKRRRTGRACRGLADRAWLQVGGLLRTARLPRGEDLPGGTVTRRAARASRKVTPKAHPVASWVRAQHKLRQEPRRNPDRQQRHAHEEESRVDRHLHGAVRHFDPHGLSLVDRLVRALEAVWSVTSK